jgi:cysteine/glycine-rich protein
MKTVYPTEKISIDGTVFHQDCLKCTKCAKKITPTSFGKLDGQYYCKPHTMELISRRGKYEGMSKSSEPNSENSSARSSTTSTPIETNSENSTVEHVNKSEAKKKFEEQQRNSSKNDVPKSQTTPKPSKSNPSSPVPNSTLVKCTVCMKTVYPTEKISIDGAAFHQDCLKCTKCGKKITPSSFGKLDGQYYCKPHTMELISRRGKYEGMSKSSDSKEATQNQDETVNNEQQAQRTTDQGFMMKTGHENHEIHDEEPSEVVVREEVVEEEVLN